MVLSFAACGSSSTSGSADSGNDVLIVGTEPTFPPFDSTDDNGNIIGFDMDLITAIGEDQGFDVEFSNLQFDSLIPALQSGNIDIIAAGMNCEDEERQAQVDFSTPYYQSGLVVAVAADNTTINSIDDLTPDMKVAAQIGTTGAEKATSLAEEGKIKEAVILNGLDTAMMQLVNGDVAAVINDLPVTNAYIKKQPDTIKIVGDVMNAESYAIAVQKGNTELLEKINAGMANIQANGKFDELYNQWFED
jgi:ABC-type amino acid transport substrate-binding protein